MNNPDATLYETWEYERHTEMELQKRLDKIETEMKENRDLAPPQNEETYLDSPKLRHAEKPQLGITPRWMWLERRVLDLCAAITRNADAGILQKEWLEELEGVLIQYHVARCEKK